MPLRVFLGMIWLLGGIYKIRMTGISSPIMIVAELGIGFAMIGGLFTQLAAVVSIIISIIYLSSGVLASDQLWRIFASLLMFGGAGRSLGLDHWIMPALKRIWNGTRFAKRTHLYLGEPRLK